MSIRLSVALALLALGGTVHAAAQPGPTVQPVMTYHGVSERLDVLAMHPKPVTRENGQIVENEMETLFELPEAPSPDASDCSRSYRPPPRSPPRSSRAPASKVPASASPAFR